jgi:hypothetical protein
MVEFNGIALVVHKFHQILVFVAAVFIAAIAIGIFTAAIAGRLFFLVFF